MKTYRGYPLSGPGDVATQSSYVRSIDPQRDEEPMHIPCGRCGGVGCYRCKWTGEEQRG